MFSLEGPQINSQEEKFDDPDLIYLSQTSKQLLEVWEGGSDGPENSIKLDRESRKYMHVFLK